MSTETRIPEAEVDPEFIERWSPRAFSPKPVSDKILASLFEAARWAPSSSNEQPWLFLYANTEEDLQIFRPLLVDANRVWADKVPVLAFAIARRTFAKNGNPNRCAVFDTGAAWMSLTLQARKLDLYTHGMGGIHVDKVYEVLGVPKDQYEVICGIAIGYLGDPSQLSAQLQEREKPSPRKPLSEVAVRGKFPQK
jgi:nitroreductase